MPPRLYVETTIFSYLTARPGRDQTTAENLRITHEWWNRRNEFDLHISETVLKEIRGGDGQMAQRRLQVAAGIPVLIVTEEVVTLSKALVHGGPVPPKALDDAVHVAIAAVHGMDYLLTWNCKHIANPGMHVRMRAICESRGYQLPAIRTPTDLM